MLNKYCTKFGDTARTTKQKERTKVSLDPDDREKDNVPQTKPREGWCDQNLRGF